jgi:UDP-GlcNAc:undecaprenyl-phosphate GlcNAc-1-phosphate transferase
MAGLLIVLAASLSVSVIVTGAVRRLATARGVLDRAGSARKVHRRPVPRLGGIGIVAGAYLALAIGLVDPGVRHALLGEGARGVAAVLAGLAAAALGTYDDVRGASPRLKLAVQLGIGCFLYQAGLRLDFVDDPLGADVALGALSLPLTVIWVAGLSNAINLIDGLDGLAGGVAVAGAVALFAIGAVADDLPAMIAALAIVGAVLGFLAYNANPASIFMGDGGSLFLGAALAALTLRPHEAGARDVPLLAMGVVLAIPIADTLLAILRRVARGVPVLSPDREHLHHRLLDLGLSHRRAVLALWAAATCLAAAGTHLACGAAARPATLVAVLLGAGIALGRLDMFRFLGEARRAQRELNRARQRAVRLACRHLRAARRTDEVVEAVRAAAPAFGAQSVFLNLDGEPIAQGRRGEAVYPLVRERGNSAVGELEVSWRAGRDPTQERDAAAGWELLCAQVAATIERLRAGPRPATRWGQAVSRLARRPALAGHHRGG